MNRFYAALSDTARDWVDTTLDSLSTEEKIGQQLAPLLNVPWQPERTKEELFGRAHRYQVGAVHLCCTDAPAGLKAELDELKAGLKVPPLISSDYEISASYRGAVNCGSSMAIGAIADRQRAAEIARRCGLLAAEQAQAIGVNWSFGPVVDIPYNPANPITSTRAFSGDPERIAELSTALISGFQDGGIAATIKHFPGDGVDDRDQHAATPYNSLPMSDWRATYGKTFGRGIDAGVYAVMVGHIALHAIAARDPRTGMMLPATLDAGVLKGLLRDEMGFDGIIISDAIAMGGATGHCDSVADASIRHILAGGDMVLFVEDLGEVIEGLRTALADGRYSHSALDASVRRILTIKATLGLHEPAAPRPTLAEAEAAVPRIRELAQEIAERSLTRVRDLDGTLPLALPAGAKITICIAPDEPRAGTGIALVDTPLDDDRRPLLATCLAARGYDVVCVNTHTALTREVADSAALIMVSNCRPVAGRNSIRLSFEGVHCFDWKLLNSGIPVVYVNFGHPQTLWEVAAVRTCIATYSAADAFQEAVAKALFGELDLPGELPVSMDFDAHARRLGAMVLS